MLNVRYLSVNIGYSIHRISYRKCAARVPRIQMLSESVKLWLGSPKLRVWAAAFTELGFNLTLAWIFLTSKVPWLPSLQLASDLKSGQVQKLDCRRRGAQLHLQVAKVILNNIETNIPQYEIEYWNVYYSILPVILTRSDIDKPHGILSNTALNATHYACNIEYYWVILFVIFRMIELNTTKYCMQYWVILSMQFKSHFKSYFWKCKSFWF